MVCGFFCRMCKRNYGSDVGLEGTDGFVKQMSLSE